jgi:Leucine-rich repeat (LRR) protein
VQQLTHLDLSDNPVGEDKSYRPTAIRKLRCLVALDGLELSPQEREAYGDSSGGVTLQMIKDNGIVDLQQSAAAEPSVAAAAAADGLGSAMNGSREHNTVLGAIVELSLDRRHIRRLQHLEELTKLRSASFLDNQISHIEGLEHCTALEELCLEDNRLTQVEGLQELGKLQKLLLGRNKIVALDQMHFVTNLTQLGVEDNELTSLAGIEPLTQLMELYAANNRLQVWMCEV